MSDITNEFIEKFSKNLNLIKPSDIPNIDLYMDQVTTFMENHLGSLKRFNEDKVLTKTMINNYAKNDLLPSPEKKKYSKDHVILLTFIYYFKSFLSISDIKTLMTPLNDKYFHKADGINIENIYSELLNQFPALYDKFSHDLADTELLADNCFDGKAKNDEYLKKLFFISLLGIDVYMKKQFIETMIDSLTPPADAKDTKKSVRDKEHNKDTN